MWRKLMGKFQKQKPDRETISEKSDLQTLIKQMQKDSNRHTRVGEKLTQAEIEQIEGKLGLTISPSYAVFLQEFGDGAYWLYESQPIDALRTPLWFVDAHPKVANTLMTENGEQIATKDLLCLMTEDANGGSWCWITSEKNTDNELPLVYYGFSSEEGPLADGGLFYKLPNFVDWLDILVKEQQEVIRALDKEDKLSLG